MASSRNPEKDVMEKGPVHRAKWPLPGAYRSEPARQAPRPALEGEEPATIHQDPR